MTVQELEVRKVPINIIKYDQSNPNKLSKEQMDSLRLTIEKFGYLAPIILNKDFTVIDGEHRVRIYLEMGKLEIPAYVIDVDNIDLKILRQLMNKLRGEHDKQMDALEFKAIFESGKLKEFSELLATSQESIEEILSKKFDIVFGKEEEPIPEKPVNPKTKLGDIYQLGAHKIMCGDSTKDLDKLYNTKPDLLLTDPPYGIDIVSHDGVGRDAKPGFTAHTKESSKFGAKTIHRRKYKQIIGDGKPFEPEFLLKHAKHCIIFGANHFANKLPNNSHWLVWDKKEGVGHDNNTFSDVEIMWTNFDKKASLIYRHLWSGLLRAGDRKTELKDRIHPTQKPVGLLKEIIKDHSEQNHIIIDPYLGSGSTLIACEQTNRICYGMEIDPGYVDVIIKRWENYTGSTAKLVSKKIAK